MLRASDHRSCLLKARALSTTVATQIGTAGSKAAVRGGRRVLVAASCAVVVSAGWTTRPVSSLNMIAPTAHKSVRASTSDQLRLACSGAR